jgi:hypothetical protein
MLLFEICTRMLLLEFCTFMLLLDFCTRMLLLDICSLMLLLEFCTRMLILKLCTLMLLAFIGVTETAHFVKHVEILVTSHRLGHWGPAIPRTIVCLFLTTICVQGV